MKKSLLLILSVILYHTVSAQTGIITLEDIWQNQKYFAKEMNEVRSMRNGTDYTALEADSKGQYIVKYSYKSGKSVDTLFNSTRALFNGKQITITDYSFSANEQFMLLETEPEAIYRHSSKAFNYFYKTGSKVVEPVSTAGKQMYATFSPSATLVAFVRENNLFLKDIVSGIETKITTDGKLNEIINGATDWVYEEEFSFSKGYQWSPEGNYIAYYKFNETQVKEFELTYYGELYPEIKKYKYPKAGEVNSTVEIHIFDLLTKNSIKADVAADENHYIPRIQWTADPGTLCITYMNRHQSELELLLCNAANGNTKKLFSEKSAAYINISDDLTFLSGNKGFIWTSSTDGFQHIYQYDMNGKMMKQITKGNYDVRQFYGFDEKSGNFYYQASVGSPLVKEVFSTNIKGKTVRISPEGGTNDATFSSNFKYCFIKHSTISEPNTYTLIESNGKTIRSIEDNKAVKTALSTLQINKPEFFKFTTEEGVELNGWMIKPANFDPGKKYPVIQYMYGGPGSQTVFDGWFGSNYMWFQMFAQKGFIVVSVDNRGTGGRGAGFEQCTYKQLGKLETIDQIATAKWLGKQTYVDASRIGSFGWSFGGYMTSLLMTKGADYFKTGIAVAPVTTWRYYDTIYTERFLQTPQENPQGYDENSPINYADLLKGNFLLIHGDADDNVHVQNSMDFITALNKEHKQFDLFIYPNKAHSIKGVRYQLYTKMTNYFLDKL